MQIWVAIWAMLILVMKTTSHTTATKPTEVETDININTV